MSKHIAFIALILQYCRNVCYYCCCLTVSMNQTAVHSPPVSEEAEDGLGHYSLKEFSKSEENRGGGVECGYSEGAESVE